jgi:hypothetical protein
MCHYAIFLAATLSTKQLLSHHICSIEELIEEIRAPRAYYPTIPQIRENASRLVRIAHELGATPKEIRYLSARKKYIAFRCILSFFRHEADANPSTGIYVAYAEACLRTITLCDFYEPELVEKLRNAIMGE